MLVPPNVEFVHQVRESVVILVNTFMSMLRIFSDYMFTEKNESRYVLLFQNETIDQPLCVDMGGLAPSRRFRYRFGMQFYGSSW
jgi:hypothetical protein